MRLAAVVVVVTSALLISCASGKSQIVDGINHTDADAEAIDDNLTAAIKTGDVGPRADPFRGGLDTAGTVDTGAGGAGANSTAAGPGPDPGVDAAGADDSDGGGDRGDDRRRGLFRGGSDHPAGAGMGGGADPGADGESGATRRGNGESGRAVAGGAGEANRISEGNDPGLRTSVQGDSQTGDTSMTWQDFTIWAMDIWTFACSIVAPFAIGYILRGRGLDKVLADIAGKQTKP